MQQIQFVDWKMTPHKLTLYLRDKSTVCVWEIPSKKRLKGYHNCIFPMLRRSLYDLAYEFTDDPTERNVIMDTLWFMTYNRESRWVWVEDGFLDKINEKYNS